MFLLEKSFIGAYCNRLYDLKERHGSFYAKAELKQTAQAKILNVANINTKVGPPNRQIGLPLNSSFL